MPLRFYLAEKHVTRMMNAATLHYFPKTRKGSGDIMVFCRKNHRMSHPHAGESTTDLLWKEDEGQLAVDVIETPEAIIIRSAVAGVDDGDVDIHVNDDMVTIRGVRHAPPLPLAATVHYEECFWGTFSRSIVLPCRVRADEADAQMTRGVLTLTIPKAQDRVRVRVRSEEV